MTTWNSRSWAAAMAIGLFGLLVPAQAYAACTGSDRAGTWKLYVMRSNNIDSGWVKCSIKVGSGGGVNSGSCTRKDAATGVTGKSGVGGGTINIQSSCKITGNIKSGGCKITISEAWMTKDKIMMSGVGKDCEGFVFQFNAVKR